MAPDKISKIIISIAYELRGLETKSWCQNTSVLEVIMCCTTFELSVILIDGGHQTVLFLYLPPTPQHPTSTAIARILEPWNRCQNVVFLDMII